MHTTFTTTAPKPVTGFNRGCLGMDTNPHGVALANVNHSGQPEPWPEGQYEVTIHHAAALVIARRAMGFR